MKLIIGIVIFFTSVIVGISSSKKYLNRYKFYNSIKNFNQDFKSILSFKRDYIEKLYKKEYKFEYFNDILKQKLSETNKNLILPNFLTDDEKNEINNYFYAVGRFDAITQNEILIQYEQLFNERIKHCYEENKKYGALYQKIGVIVGLIGFIIVV